MFLIPGLLIVYLAFSIGRKCIAPLAGTLDSHSRVLVSTAAGLGVIAYAVLTLGLLGFLSPAGLWVLLAIFMASAAFGFRNDLEWLKEILIPRRGAFSALDAAVLVFSLFAIAAAFAGTSAPETANDSLCYHLNLPKIYLAENRIANIPFDTNSGFPLLMEMLYTLGLGLGSVSLAKFFHFATGILTAALIAVRVHKISGDIRSGLAAGALFLTAPVILNQLSSTYVDVALACFTFFALDMFLEWFDKKEGRYLVLAGVFCGLALGVKFLALISILILFLFILVESLRNDRPAAVRNLAWFSLAVFSCGAFWYIRSWVQMGNPVYPYFASIFGAGDTSIHYDDIGVAKNPLSFLTAFWTLTMKPQIFEGFGVQIGPAFLAFLPLSFGLLKNRKLQILGIYSILFFIGWFLLGQSLRFLAPVLPALAVLIGAGLAALPANIPSLLLKILFTAVLGVHAALALYHYRHDFNVASGKEPSQIYLAREERSYKAALFSNSNLPESSHILNADETHMFYFKRKITRESVYVSMGNRYWEGAAGPADVFRNLKKAGFTHILRAYAAGERGKFGAATPLRISPWIDALENDLASYLNPLYTYEFTDRENRKTIYTLYLIL